MYTINAYYLKEKLLFPLDSLLYDFDHQAKKSDVIAYIQSAGIFKYLYETYGVEKMKLLWTDGFENFNTIYGFSVSQLEADWHTFIQTIPLPKDFDINKLKEGCGQIIMLTLTSVAVIGDMIPLVLEKSILISPLRWW